MTKICLRHNGICNDYIWLYPSEDVAEEVRLARIPVSLEPCPKCKTEKEKEVKFIKGG